MCGGRLLSDSTISILVRDADKPCAPYQTTGHWFYVDIFNCDGKYLKWRGVTYKSYRLRERIHDQIKVPSGCYIIRGYAPCLNVTCDLAMVVVGCKETVCVNLLPTRVRLCLRRLTTALHLPEIREKIPELVEAATGTLKEVAEYLPKPVFPPPLPVTIEQMVKEAEEKPKEEKKEECTEKKGIT